ncbi:MAG: cytochrome c biogenesis protein CcsA [Bacteroidales bacterium]|nr:cytochrome c biogenesis protein CcsA [Bacteroidales bacterium]
MIGWNLFPLFAVPSVLLWILGAGFAWRSKKVPARLLTVLGLLIYAAFITGLWLSLDRPPLRTQGETRLWFAFFLPLTGVVVYARWRYRWILSFTTLLALVFICVNIFKPEIHNKTLMPALMSPWFAPHVIVYMLSYAILGASALVGAYLLFFRRSKIGQTEMAMTDNLVYVGLTFLTFGLLFGALWAKEVWGTYWGWDPKETWAAITWLCYLMYIHFRKARPRERRKACLILLVSFVCLQICWWGINYLPSARGFSVHTY